MPFHDKEKQLHISAGKGGGWDVNVSYAFSKHFSFFTAGTYDKGLKRRITILGDPFRIKKNDYAVRAGLGYFKKIDFGVFNILEFMGGAGTYKVQNYWYFTDANPYYELMYREYTNARFTSLFAQMQMAVKGHAGERALALRFSYSRYRSFAVFDAYYSNTQTKLQNFWTVNIDPVASYSYYFKRFKLNVQSGVSIPLKKVRLEPPSIYETVMLATVLGRLGIQYNLDLKNK
ncbi:MAG TPA: hypothetical protein VM368_05165 [Flavisolibacter sp.]|nr:hypothetical protein [Flavisolibacter sp.]